MKRVLLLLGIMFSVLSASADENVLQTIEIEPVKDTYNIVLVSDKAVDVKKTIQASNKITLSMKDIRVSKTLNTIYNNVSNVDTVMVEPHGNGIKIFFQADNASAATVSFDALVASAPIVPVKTKTQSIKLNNPIESYAPIYNDTFEEVKTSTMFDKLKAKSVATLKDSIDEDTVSDTANKTFSFGLIGLLAFAVIRFTTVNYGINAYQKENRNPYESETIQFHNPRLRNYATPTISDSVTQTISRPVQPQVATMTQPQTRKMTTPVNSAPVNQSNPNVDNLKFLESMTAIYEKSGRHDLARGLKASLSKNNVKQ